MSWLDVVLPLTLSSIWLGRFVWRLRDRAILPLHDPEFDETIGRIIERGEASGRRRRIDMTDAHGSTVARGPRQEKPESRHEDADINVLGIFTFCVGLLVSAILIQGMVWLLFQYFSGRESVRLAPEYPLAAGQETRVPPEPRLQTDPRADLRELRAHEGSVLGTYGWVDKAAGVVRIPVEEAMRITAQRGLPARSAPGDAQK